MQLGILVILVQTTISLRFNNVSASFICYCVGS
jgi:hypothetical protein